MEDNWGHSKKLHTYRYEILFNGIEASDVYKNKNVLELAPFMGWFSEELNKSCEQLDLVELHPTATNHLNEIFKKEIITKKVNVYASDIHHQIFQLEPIYNLVTCCGFLYHTPHPFWVLEGIAKLSPQYILIDTHCGDQAVYLKDSGKINQYGMRQSRQPTVPYNLVISDDVLLKSMEKLGYELLLKVDKTHADVSHLNLPEEFS
ncbi:MAG: hypothetical protein ABL930_11660, partial [Pseudobdellovibrio sp.]